MYVHPTALVETPPIGEGTRAVCGACGREFEGGAAGGAVRRAAEDAVHKLTPD